MENILAWAQRVWWRSCKSQLSLHRHANVRRNLSYFYFIFVLVTETNLEVTWAVAICWVSTIASNNIQPRLWCIELQRVLQSDIVEYKILQDHKMFEFCSQCKMLFSNYCSFNNKYFMYWNYLERRPQINKIECLGWNCLTDKTNGSGFWKRLIDKRNIGMA